MRLDLSHYLPKLAIDAPIRSLHRRPRRATIAWVAGLVLVGLATLVTLLPTLMSARYRAEGEAALAGDAASAAEAFQQALRWSPDDPDTYRALAQSRLLLGQPQSAIDALERAFRLRPDSLLIRQELARAYEVGGQFQRADGVWAALGISAQEMLALGEQARRAKQYAEALEWYARAGRAAPGMAEPLYYAGRAYRETRRVDESLRALRQAGALAPDNRDVWYEFGQSYAARREGQQALEALRRGLDAHTGQAGQSNLLYWIGYVHQYALTPRDPRGAEAAYTQALALDDYRVDPWQKAESYHQRGILLAWQKRWQAAVQEYNQALALSPKHYAAHLSLAQGLWQLGRREEAIAQAREALAIDPNKKQAYRVLGDFYALEQNTAEASAMYARVLELDPKDEQVRKALEMLR